MPIRQSRSSDNRMGEGELNLNFVSMQNSTHPNQTTKKLKKITIKTDRKLKDTHGMDVIFSVKLSPSGKIWGQDSG